MIQLRHYQEKSVGEIREAFLTGVRRVLLVSPTGSGKTVMFSWLGAAVAAKGKRVVILVHRQELVKQVSAALAAMGVMHGTIARGAPQTDESVQVAMIGTLARRLDRTQAFDLIVIDEAHHGIAASWKAVMAAMPNAFILGVTATPERLDGKGLGAVFAQMIEGPTTAELITDGFLVPAWVYGSLLHLDLSAVRTRAGDYVAEDLAEVMGQQASTDDVIAHWRRRAAGVPTVAFCTTIAHSKDLAAQFCAAGIPAGHVDGSTDAAERGRLIAALGTGEIQVLSNADLIGEGIDIPTVGAVILLRPTKSVARYLQAIGRALRPAQGKIRAIVLDHAASWWTFGLPDAPRVWSLADAPSRSKASAQAPGARLRQCTSCGGVHLPRTPTCATCATDLQPGPVEAREIEAEDLVRRLQAERAVAERIRRMSHSEVKNWADTKEKLQLAARVKGYKSGWIWHRLQELENN